MTMHEKLLQEAEKLVQLLKEDERGCFTWHQTLHERIDNIYKIYYGNDNE